MTVQSSIRAKKSIAKKSIRASKWDRERKATLYTCGVHFQHEMAEAEGPQVFYNSIKEFKKSHSCWKSCGIVEVNVTFSNWVRAETIGDGMRGAKKMTPVEIERMEKNLKIRSNRWHKYLSDLRSVHSDEQKASKQRTPKR
jgi:hypothetical protein